jgi:hypothetical protein
MADVAAGARGIGIGQAAEAMAETMKEAAA